VLGELGQRQVVPRVGHVGPGADHQLQLVDPVLECDQAGGGGSGGGWKTELRGTLDGPKTVFYEIFFFNVCGFIYFYI
jgi:hypothetical protein